MAFKVDGVDLSKFVYGWGTAATFGDYSTVEAQCLSINDKRMRYVLKNSAFMPFSNSPAISGYTKVGSPILRAGMYAGVNRFMLSVQDRYSTTAKGSSSTPTVISYKGGGSYNSKGTLKVGSTEFQNCPPVIVVYAQGRGGNGGGGRKDGIWLGQTFTAGGGGGSGAFWAFFLELPYDTGGVFKEVISFIQDASVTFRYNGIDFATVGRGSDGQTPDDKEYGHRNGGAGGSVSSYILPSIVKSCALTKDGTALALTSLKGVSGGGGGTGGGSFGAIVESTNGNAGGSMPSVMRLYVSAAGHQVPPVGTFKSGAGGGGNGGGGGGGSRMGSGGNGAGGGNGYGGGGNGGDASGFGAG